MPRTSRTLLKDTCPLAAEILNGDHDDILGYIEQAAKARKKAMYRRGSRVRIIQGQMKGKEGVVLKVNAARLSIGVGDEVVMYPGEQWEYKTYADGEWNIPPTMLEVI